MNGTAGTGGGGLQFAGPGSSSSHQGFANPLYAQEPSQPAPAAMGGAFYAEVGGPGAGAEAAHADVGPLTTAGNSAAPASTGYMDVAPASASSTGHVDVSAAAAEEGTFGGFDDEDADVQIDVQATCGKGSAGLASSHT